MAQTIEIKVEPAYANSDEPHFRLYVDGKVLSGSWRVKDFAARGCQKWLKDHLSTKKSQDALAEDEKKRGVKLAILKEEFVTKCHTYKEGEKVYVREKKSKTSNISIRESYSIIDLIPNNKLKFI